MEKEPGPQGEESPVTDAPVDAKRKREYKEFGHDDEKPTRTHAFLTLPRLQVLTVPLIDANVDMSLVCHISNSSPRIS